MIKTDVGYYYQELREDESGYDIVLTKQYAEPQGRSSTTLRHTFGKGVKPVVGGPELLRRAQEALGL